MATKGKHSGGKGSDSGKGAYARLVGFFFLVTLGGAQYILGGVWIRGGIPCLFSDEEGAFVTETATSRCTKGEPLKMAVRSLRPMGT